MHCPSSPVLDVGCLLVREICLWKRLIRFRRVDGSPINPPPGLRVVCREPFPRQREDLTRPRHAGDLSRFRQAPRMWGRGRESDWELRNGNAVYRARKSPREGYSESFNGKLRGECLDREIFYPLKEAQTVIELWRGSTTRGDRTRRSAIGRRSRRPIAPWFHPHPVSQP